MRDKLRNLFTALFAVLFAASLGTAYAVESATGDLATSAQQQEPPKDCKKNPDDPRCKDERKY